MVREISQPRMVTGDLIGIPDVIAFKHGRTLLIECKRPGGRLRKSQKRFIEEIEEHIDFSLNYIIANDVENFIQSVNHADEMWMQYKSKIKS